MVTANSNSVVAFDAQGMLGNKTGIGMFNATLIEELAKALPHTLFVGYYYSRSPEHGAELPQATNIQYVRHAVLPIKAVNLLRRFGVEVPVELHAHGKVSAVLFLNYLSSPSIFRTRKIGFIYDLSYLDQPEYVSRKNRLDLARFVPITLQRCQEIITISKFTKERIRSRYPASNKPVAVLPIPPTSSSSKHAQLTTRLLSFGIKKQRYILYIGTVEPRKNLNNLMLAYKLLPKDIRSLFTLVLAGGKGWNDKATLEKLEKLQAEGYDIVKTGYVSEQERSALYTNASCMILPSHYEGFGMPIFEAFQHDTPVALSDIPVFHEVAGDAAIFFDKDRPESIANSITRIVSDEALRSKLRTQGKKQLTKYSWQENAKVVSEALARVTT